MASGVALNTDTTLDLWITTLEGHEWSETDRTVYLLGRHFFPMMNWLLDAGRRQEADPGTNVAWEVIYDDGDASTMVNEGEERTRTTSNATVKCSIPFAHQVNNFSMLGAEIRRNVGRARLKNLAKNRRQRTMTRMAVDFEGYMWAMPDATNNKKFMSVPYYVVPITGAQVTATTSGQQGYLPGGFSACAGLASSSTTYSRWANYNDVWTNSSGEITDTDLERMGNMWVDCHFQAPMVASDLRLPQFNKFLIAGGRTTMNALGRAARRQNSDLGRNVTSYLGAGLGAANEPLFNSFPLTYVEDLNTADTTNRGAYPLYMLSRDEMYFVVEKGMFFAETKPMNDVTQPDVFTTHVDLSGNLKCENRRPQGVISYVAAA